MKLQYFLVLLILEDHYIHRIHSKLLINMTLGCIMKMTHAILSKRAEDFDSIILVFNVDFLITIFFNYS